MAASLVEDVGRGLEDPEMTHQTIVPLEKGNDPAELVKLPTYVYTKELLLKLKNHPASVSKPECLDPIHMVSKSGKWDPEHWMGSDSNKRANGSAGTGGEDKYDKKDKSKEEGDDYCFTPQRRSFVRGCQVTAVRRQDTEDTAPVAEKDRETQPRRVGTTRPVREVEIKEKGRRDLTALVRGSQPRERDHRVFGPKTQAGEKEPRKVYERSGHEREMTRGSRMNGYNDRRKNDETPEWFHGGPVSQSDTIELVGFDDETKKAKHKVQMKQESNGPSTIAGSSTGNSKEASSLEKKKEPEFNIDDLLNMESVGFNGLGIETAPTESSLLEGSKFSRWFSKAEQAAESKVENSTKDKEDAAKSLLEMLHKGGEQQLPEQPKLSGVLTAEEVEKMANKKDALAALRTLLPQAAMKEKENVAARPMTEQDLLANLLGNRLNVSKPAVPQPNKEPPPDDALTRFLQSAQVKQHGINQQRPAVPPVDVQLRPDVQALMRNAAMAGPHTLQQLEMMAIQRQLMQAQQFRQQQPPIKQSSASPLSFTPTAVMRKMTADKDKDKTPKGSNLEKANENDIDAGTRESPSQGSVPRGSASATPVQRNVQQGTTFGVLANQLPLQNATTDIALRLLEQQHQQQQLLAAAAVVTAAQNQLKHQLTMQQQRISPLQQLLPQAAPPILPPNHFRPIHPQPVAGFAPLMAGPAAPAAQQQPRGLNGPFNRFNLQQQMAVLRAAQRMNVPANRIGGGVAQPNVNTPLARWLPPNLPLQGPPNLE